MRIIAIFLALVLIAGCAKHSGTDQKPAAAPAVVDLPVTMEDGVQIVQLTGNDAMKYNGTHFILRAKQPVRVELKNVGTKAKDQMAHNFVLLKTGTDVTVFNMLSAQAKETGYMPPAMAGDVLTSTPFAGPGETVQAAFVAPDAGEYPFLCNFPGHFAAGMNGTVTVTP